MDEVMKTQETSGPLCPTDFERAGLKAYEEGLGRNPDMTTWLYIDQLALMGWKVTHLSSQNYKLTQALRSLMQDPSKTAEAEQTLKEINEYQTLENSIREKYAQKEKESPA